VTAEGIGGVALVALHPQTLKVLFDIHPKNKKKKKKKNYSRGAVETRTHTVDVRGEKAARTRFLITIYIIDYITIDFLYSPPHPTSHLSFYSPRSEPSGYNQHDTTAEENI
jgi:hypothetical protein